MVFISREQGGSLRGMRPAVCLNPSGVDITANTLRLVRTGLANAAPIESETCCDRNFYAQVTPQAQQICLSSCMSSTGAKSTVLSLH